LRFDRLGHSATQKHLLEVIRAAQNRLDLRARAMHRYRVIGYDANGQRLFTLRVESLTKTDAKLMAMALLRRNGSGAALVNRAEKLVVRRDLPTR
jgi:hypothetical protein